MYLSILILGLHVQYRYLLVRTASQMKLSHGSWPAAATSTSMLSRMNLVVARTLSTTSPFRTKAKARGYTI